MRLTLRFRIIEGMAFFTILLIFLFSALLLLREKDRITQHNLYRARVGTFAAKEALERTLLSTVRVGDSMKAFKKLIPLLKESQLSEGIWVADLKGKIVASAASHETGLPLPANDQELARYATKTYSPQQWFHLSQTAPEEVALYVPITLDDVPQYVAVFRYSLGNIRDAVQQVAKMFVLTVLGVILVVTPLCLVLIRAILGPIRTLNSATKDVAAGNLGLQVAVPTEDELGELADTFNQMTSALVKMKERAENANPLTKLPGNNVIHEEIEKRIKGNIKFVVIYSDLDNFKAFNDKYGIGEGDKAIKLTAQVMREAIRTADPKGFLGHEGGDDFLILSTPEKAQAVADYVTTEFDKRIKELYSPEDRQKGFIISKDREGSVKQFALMTISLAGVTNAQRPLTSYAEVTNICAEVKKKTKGISKSGGKSTFYLDQRTAEEASAAPKVQAG